jgi:thiol peroxidase
MTVERFGAVTFRGKPLTVIGEPLQVGDVAPDVELVAPDLSPFRIRSTDGKIRILSVVPSLDTGVCDAQTRRFDQEVARFGDEVVLITVSADLPFAQRRWAAEANAQHVLLASDHREMAFGQAYGTWVKELRLEQRAVFVLDRDGTIRYVEYVPEIAQHPNYDAALEAVRALLGQPEPR